MPVPTTTRDAVAGVRGGRLIRALRQALRIHQSGSLPGGALKAAPLSASLLPGSAPPPETLIHQPTLALPAPPQLLIYHGLDYLEVSAFERHDLGWGQIPSVHCSRDVSAVQVEQLRRVGERRQEARQREAIRRLLRRD